MADNTKRKRILTGDRPTGRLHFDVLTWAAPEDAPLLAEHGLDAARLERPRVGRRLGRSYSADHMAAGTSRRLRSTSAGSSQPWGLAGVCIVQ